MKKNAGTIFEKLVNKHLRGAPFYIPGPLIKDICEMSGLEPNQIIKLSSNENPLGPPPMAVKAAQDSARTISIYPDSRAAELRTEISNWLAMEFTADNIVVGRGSSEIMSFMVRAFSKPGDEIVCLEPSFTLHQEVAAVDGRKPIVVKLKSDDFELYPSDIKKAISKKTRLIFIARPNNPTSRLASLDVVKEISDHAEGAIVVCDEAYVEFADDYRAASGVNLIHEDSNVLVTRTFSKAFGISDMRVGYAVGPKSAIQYLMQVKPKWNIGTLAQKVAIAALHDTEHFRKTLDTVRKGRVYLVEELLKMGFKVVPEPQGNFIMVKVSVKGFTAEMFFRELALRGFSIRGGRDDFGEDYVRISVGTEVQNRDLIDTIRKITKRSLG